VKQGIYADFEIIKLKRLYSKRLWSYDLETDSVMINEANVRFAYREVLDGQARMLLPDHFSPMPEELARMQYLSEHRPGLILHGSDLTENLGASIIRRDGRDLRQATEVMRDAVRQTAPETVSYDAGTIVAKNCEGYWFEYKSFTITDEAYNIQFLLGSEETLLHGAFNCSIRVYDEWKPHIIKALEYTEILDSKEKHALLP
jgi:hypothetical protein